MDAAIAYGEGIGTLARAALAALAAAFGPCGPCLDADEAPRGKGPPRLASAKDGTFGRRRIVQRSVAGLPLSRSKSVRRSMTAPSVHPIATVAASSDTATAEMGRSATLRGPDETEPTGGKVIVAKDEACEGALKAPG